MAEDTEDDLDKFVEDRLGWKRVADRISVDLAVQRRIVERQDAELQSLRELVSRLLKVAEAAREIALCIDCEKDAATEHPKLLVALAALPPHQEEGGK